ncbi:hypothetical protein METH_22350 (plasmid) [Leisingera methylohalidivorans DSM 14336]|uniref:Uncharacterized protein n=1 Tax=Leisingera methylohalidivorans DSM 14336 TaxID=999552 RepID=V9W325_9RHOB|nr:hypothetical protein METH_22350 [Leisingera methylohalidivorans DSM 14336]
MADPVPVPRRCRDRQDGRFAGATVSGAGRL